jgi:hypothetical protein
MSLIDLNPDTGSSTTLPRYVPQSFTNPDPGNQLANFGWDMDVANEIMVASTPSYYRNAIPTYSSVTFSPATITNAIHIYQNVDENWTNIQTLDGFGLETDNFGFAVSLNKDDASYIAVGAFNRSSAVALAYIFVSDGAGTPTYSLQQTFNSTNYPSITDATNVGYQVKLNAAGNHLLLMGSTGIVQQFSRSGTTWTHDTGDTLTATGDASSEGLMLGIDANSDHSIIVRGSPFYPLAAAKAAQTGIVEVFRSATSPTETFTGSAGDRIGSAIAVSADGLFMAYSSLGLAAELDLRTVDTSGYVSIFNTVAGILTLQQTFTGLTVDSSTGSFGTDLALTQAGNFLLIGDAYADVFGGKVHVCTRSDDIWIVEFTLSDNTTAENTVITAANNSLFLSEADVVGPEMIITAGTYIGTDLATEITTQLNLNADLSNTYLCVYGSDFFTISRATGSSSFKVYGTVSTLGANIGMLSDSTLGASDILSTTLPLLSNAGSELGRNVNLTLEVAAFVTSGYPGAYGLLSGVKAEGIAGLFFSTTALNLFQSAVTIDVTDNNALLVRKNNNSGDVFNVDTATGDDGLVTSYAPLCVENTTDSTSSTTGALKVSGGVAVAKNLNVSGTTTLEDDVTYTSKLVKTLTTTPTLSASLTLPSTTLTFGYYKKGFYYATVVDGDRKINVYDVSDPTATPVLAGSFNLTSAGIGNVVGEMYVLNDFLYMVSQDIDDLISLDVRDKTSITEASSLPLTVNTAGCIAFSGKYAFQVGFFGNTEINTIDISDPFNMVIVATFTNALVQGANTPDIVDNYLYFANDFAFAGPDYIVIIDIRDPLNLSLVSALSSTTSSEVAQIYNVRVQGNLMYTFHNGVADYLKVWDIEDPSLPVFLGKYTADSGISQPFSNIVQNGYVFMALTFLNSIGIYDVSDPTNILQTAILTIDETNTPTGMFIDGQYLFFASRTTPEATLSILDLNGTNIQTCNIGNLKVASMRCHRDSEFYGPVAMSSGLAVAGSITGQGGLGSAQDLTVGRVNATINPYLTKTNKRTGSFLMADGAGPATLGAGDDLDFSGQKLFVIECYVEIDATTDLWSHYKLVGVNESLVSGGGDAWSLTTTRNGITDPGVVFNMNGGQLEYTTLTYAGYSHAHIYYEVVTNLL